MIRRFLRRLIDRAELQLGLPLDEGRYMLEHSPRAFLAFSTVQTWSNRHKALPASAYYVDQIAALREEECGSCLQIAVNLANRAGVDRELVRLAARGREELLSREFRDIFRFVQQQANRIDNNELRERIRARWGDEALIELALAVAGARMFPAVKRTLGYARSCQLVSA